MCSFFPVLLFNAPLNAIDADLHNMLSEPSTRIPYNYSTFIKHIFWDEFAVKFALFMALWHVFWITFSVAVPGGVCVCDGYKFFVVFVISPWVNRMSREKKKKIMAALLAVDGSLGDVRATSIKYAKKTRKARFKPWLLQWIWLSHFFPFLLA